MPCLPAWWSGEAINHLAVAIDEEFGKIPFDRLGAEHAGSLFLQIVVQRMGIVAIDVDLVEHRETYTVVQLAEFLNLPAGARLLRAKLVTGKPSTDFKPVVLILPVQVFQPSYCGVKPHLLAVLMMIITLLFVFGNALLLAIKTIGFVA